MNKNGFFDSVSGNLSSTRLIAVIIIGFTLLFIQEILYWGRTNIVAAAAAAGGLFVAMAGPTMFYLYQNKQTEVKHEEVKQETAALTNTSIPKP